MATLLAAVAVSMVAASRVDRLASANYLDGSTTRSLVPDAVHNILVRADSLYYFDRSPSASGAANLALNPNRSGGFAVVAPAPASPCPRPMWSRCAPRKP